jgi:uncharacterized protein YbjT (DUF2867 family)
MRPSCSSTLLCVRACGRAGVRRVAQISALGADEHAASAYHLTKRSADDALRALPVSSLIVQPLLVFSPERPNTKFFTAWSTLPVVPLLGRGVQRVRPVHIDDLVELVAKGVLATQGCAASEAVMRVGPEPMTMRRYLGVLARLANGASPIFFRYCYRA